MTDRARLELFGVLAGCALPLMLLLAYANHTLGGDQPNPYVLAAFGALFLMFVYSLVPLFVHAFVVLQRGAGNAEREPIVWLAAHERAVTWAFWGIWTLGLLIAVPAMLLDQGLLRWPVGESKGVLVANVGMPIDEVRKQSTFALNGKAQLFVDDVVFDFEVKGTPTRFPRSRYYWLDLGKAGSTEVRVINVGISAEKVPRAELDQADARVRAQLERDGWAPALGDRVPTGTHFRYGSTVLHLERKRMDEEKPGEDPATAGEWIQFVELWPRRDSIFDDLHFADEPATPEPAKPR
ncbi:MAG TPA: hypothetical protein VHM19_00925 [Polyangiales bacterium]|nr:hypothetical protein [Polyangiales bacterium]